MLPDWPFTIFNVELSRSEKSTVRRSEGPKWELTCFTVSASPDKGCGPGLAARLRMGKLLQKGCLMSKRCTPPHLHIESALGASASLTAPSTAAVNRASELA